jgi:hypothetical protein
MIDITIVFNEGDDKELDNIIIENDTPPFLMVALPPLVSIFFKSNSFFDGCPDGALDSDSLGNSFYAQSSLCEGLKVEKRGIRYGSSS